MTDMTPFDPNQEIGDFDVADLGVIPPYTKEQYEKGLVVIVVGVSDGEFEGEYDEPAKSLLHYMPDSDQDFQPYGLLVGKKSRAITMAQAQLQKNGNKPFYALVSKKQGKTFRYWLLEPVKIVFTPEGQIGGFRVKDGSIITNPEPLG
ncbi:MAG TPA: hypothetical protein VH593_29100 [Ktedonobacteraceae bacterium]